MHAVMATTKKGAKGAPKVKAARADGRPKSKLTIAAEEAALGAKRKLLLDTLTACDWNLSRVCETLEMGSVSQVIRSIRETGLEPQYEAAKKRGDIKPGPRARSES